MTQPIMIGVSACLLGERVRYDGGHNMIATSLTPWGRISALSRCALRLAADCRSRVKRCASRGIRLLRA